MSSELLVVTRERDAHSVLPALALLAHRARLCRPENSDKVAAGSVDAVLVDARTDLAGARVLCRSLSGGEVPVVGVLTEGALVTVAPEWGLDEVLLATSEPAEVEARLRLARERSVRGARAEPLAVGDLAMEESSYTARLEGHALELTYKEFELLKFLVQHAGRVFTRSQLVREVWAYDFFGGTRTVDVHIRRLRAKLGPGHEAMIATVRNVGYRFVPPSQAHGSSGLPTASGDTASNQGSEELAAAVENAMSTPAD